MSQDIASLVLRVDSLEARNATTDIKKLAKEGKNTEGVFKGFGRTIAGLGIGTAIGALLGSMVKNTIEAEESLAQLEARLKSTQGVSGMTMESLTGLSTELMNVTTFSDEAIQGAEALLLTFTKVGKDVFPQATAAALDMSTALGTDLNSATLQLGKALNDPIKGITALSRAGVQFTAAQKETIKTMVETNNIVGAQKIILKELETQMGGAAAAARNTLGGAIEGLKNQFGELMEGDSGGEGVHGATDAINELTALMASPDTKAAFGNVVEGLIKVIDFSVRAITAVAGLTQAIRDHYAEANKMSYEGLLTKQEELKASIKEGERMGTPWSPGVSKDTIKQMERDLDEINGLVIKKQQAIQRGMGVWGQPNSAQNLKHGGDLQWIDPPSPKITSGGGGGDGEDAAKKAKKAAEAAAKEQARALDSLRDTLATEEEAIRTSYAERQDIIDKAANLGAAEREQLSQRNLEMRDEELAELTAKDREELESLRLSLRTEEEAIQESYAKRIEIIDANTKGNEALAAQLKERETARRDEELQELAEAQQRKHDQLYEGYLTEEELAKEAHLRQRQEILESTAITEAERQDLLRREEEKFMQESADRERQRVNLITSATADLFGSLANSFSQLSRLQGAEGKKAFDLSKKLSIAQAIIKTYESATNAYASLSSIPYVGPALGAAAAAAAVVAGMMNVQQIKAQTFSGAYDKGGFIPGGKWGIAGEYGPEFIRGPAHVTSRADTAKLLENASSGGNKYQINVNVLPGATRETADQAADAMAQKLGRVQRNNR